MAAQPHVRAPLALHLACVAFLAHVHVGVRAQDARKNVLLLIVDDMRPELGAYAGGGYPIYPNIHTPNMDAIAARSHLFTNAHAQYAVCNPSRSSLLTSRRPDATRVYDRQTYWRVSGGDFTSLPQYFKDAGYLTAGMGKVYHQGARAGISDDPPSWSAEIPCYHPPDNDHYDSFDVSWDAVAASRAASHPLPDQEITRHTKDVLGQVSGGAQPFFMAVGFHKPHLPFTFPESYLDLYPEADIALAANSAPPTDMPVTGWSKYPSLRKYGDIAALRLTGNMGTTVPDYKALELRRAYYATVSYIDGLVGELMAEVSRLGLDDNTVVALLGDNGYHLGEHAQWTKSTNFDEATRVPLMVAVPGVTDAGGTSERLVELVDVFPTLVEAAGVTGVSPCPQTSSGVLTCSEGSSLMPLMIQGGLASWKDAAFSQMKTGPKRMSYSIRTTQYRYTEIYYWDSSTGVGLSNIKGVELYDYQTDPQGNANQANNPAYSQIAGELSTKLRDGWYPVRENM